MAHRTDLIKYPAVSGPLLVPHRSENQAQTTHGGLWNCPQVILPSLVLPQMHTVLQDTEMQSSRATCGFLNLPSGIVPLYPCPKSSASTPFCDRLEHTDHVFVILGSLAS